MGRVALAAILVVVGLTAGFTIWFWRREPESSTDVIAIVLVPLYGLGAIVIGLLYLLARVTVSAVRGLGAPSVGISGKSGNWPAPTRIPGARAYP